MKKILFVANVTKEHILKFHTPTIKKFKDMGWQVDVASFGEDKVPYCDNQFNACWRRSPFTFRTILGIAWLKKLIKKQQYDIIYCHTPVGGFVGRIAAASARKRGTRVVYCAHGLHFFKGAPLLNWLIFYPIEKFLARFTDLFITINDEDFKTVKKRFLSCPNVNLINGIGVDFSRLNIANAQELRVSYRTQLKIPQNATVLIYIAELNKNKNQQLLINALSLLQKSEKNVFLLLVGPDYANGEYEELAKKLGVFDNVRFLGWRSDIAALLASADICTASSLREGFGINLVEAMYMGLPVVASNNRGHRTIIKNNENGLLVESNSAEEMAEKISYLINNPQIAQEFSKCDVNVYDCDYIADELYSTIVNL